ncbi:nucleotidyltransferase family protein [Candidatus Woesearchaeota archaeon]|nr:nucleotidyltransferase family protein [Candidatus Woesearchaeota archaeon]
MTATKCTTEQKLTVIILAAGYATRLYPLTLDTPKPLLDVRGKPMIEHILDTLSSLPISQIIIVTNNKFYERFTTWNQQYNFPIPISIINDKTMSNEDRLGAVGDIAFAIKYTPIDLDTNGGLLVVGGDNLFDFDLQQLYALYFKKKATVVAAYDFGDPMKLSKKYGVLELNGEGRIIGMEEKPEFPKTSIASTAIYLFTPSDASAIFELCNGPKLVDNSGELLKWLAQHRGAYALCYSGEWFDIGSHEELAAVNAKASRRAQQ